MEISKIGFIRHGETDWNTAKRSQGHSDIPLNESGEQQAHRVGQRATFDSWDVIYSSDLQRAKKTAEIITEYTNIPYFIDERLRERHGGKIEGTTKEERIAQWGKSWQSHELGIETDEQVSERGLSFFKDKIEKHFPKSILIVSHGSFLKQILRTLLPNENVDVSLGNCSLTILTTTKKEWQLKLHNDVEHMSKVHVKYSPK